MIHYLRSFILTCMVFLASVASAQEDDKGFLTRTIQNALSGAGRTVSIDGFAGALSSRATFDQMTISDDQGVWLTLEGVELDWNRSALLRGRLEVQALTAKRLSVPRLPVAQEDTLPDPEAKPFSFPTLPDLPVAVDVANFEVAEIFLGAPILGEAAQMNLTATAKLNTDVATLDIDAVRTDGKQGVFKISADLNRNDRLLDLLINLSEEPNGILSRSLNIPDEPSVNLTVAGQGPLSDFNVDINLATDAAERLSGQVNLAEQGAADDPDRRIQADLRGDVTALVLSQYRAFFGTDVGLTVDALVRADGGLEVSDLALAAQAAKLRGKFILDSEKWPSVIDITGTVAATNGERVLLPVSGASTYVRRMDLDVKYNVDDGDEITAVFDVDGLATDALAIERSRLDLTGALAGNSGAVGTFNGDLVFSSDGLTLTNAAMSEALGQALNGRANIAYETGAPVQISGLDLSGTDYGLSGDISIFGAAEKFLTQLKMRLEADDITRFSALSGRDLGGAAHVDVAGQIQPLDGMFDVNINGLTRDLKVGVDQADAVLVGETALSVAALRDETGTFVRDLSLENAALTATGGAELRSNNSQARFMAKLTDIALIAPQYSGPVTLTAQADQDSRGWTVDASADGPYGTALTAKGLATGPNAVMSFAAEVPEIKDFVPDTPIEGKVALEGLARQTPAGWQVDAKAQAPEDVSATVNGPLTPLDIDFEATIPRVQAFAPQVAGTLTASGNLRQSEGGIVIDAQAEGPYAAKAAVQGALTPVIDISFDAALPEVNRVVPQVSGPLTANGRLRQTDKGFFIDTSATGLYGARAMVEGLATGPDMSLTFDVSLPDVQPLMPGVSGPLAATGAIRQTPDGIAVDTTATGPYASRAQVAGVVTGAVPALTYDVTIPNLAALVPQLNGPLNVTGTAQQEAAGWRLNTNADGPAGTQATIAGLVGTDGTLNIDIDGNAPLGLSAPFTTPRILQGQAAFDLSVNGPPQLGSVTGTIRTSNASLSAPNLRIALKNIAANINIGNNSAQVDLSAESTEGGQIKVDGAVGLTGSMAADLQIALNNLVLIDPSLYRTSLNGGLSFTGPLTGGARIDGRIDVGETSVTVPSTGLTSIGDIPQIDFVGAPADVIATRHKAGLNGGDAGTDVTDDSSGLGYGLNVRINAPNRIFVRGRGLDAELGGSLLLTGTTNQMISAGRFDLIRGRLDILGKRFNLTEGAVKFQGELVPYLRFVTATTTQTGEARIIIEGPATAPEVSFESTPASPQDEVLAQLLFGRNISEISAFQALQLANAVATLAGRGGAGVISNLRSGFGLDDLDVTTTDSGATAVRAGKYISDNVYTDVTAASDGSADISINLDISKSLTAKGTVGSDGNTGIGLFFEKDY
ncbi:autotransporter secretion inner membrane protein TamB [Sulfitobacter marinus]|uniref:Autotransporter secretion inner membrane protein TamB n=1 Tax=Sulfitobacter marinus TaxID=394264 RepID=A0A1I6RY44_9RHOB|nr:translocation/assembly module TamB domain-containing protein [Sulfitobacter marinus]SFS69621.1 autotransporter secretion inner membrane protein TamB [Sulfitobacter marinus]